MGLFSKKKAKGNGGYSTSASEFGKTINSKTDSFEELVREFESLGKEKSIELCFQTVKETINKLNEKQLMAYTMFMFWSVSVDGKLTKEEFIVTKPVFAIILKDEEIDYSYARGFVEGISHRDALDYESKISYLTKDLLSGLDRKTATDVLLTGVLLSACDGHICEEEKAFLKSVIY